MMFAEDGTRLCECVFDWGHFERSGEGVCTSCGQKRREKGYWDKGMMVHD